MQFIMADNFLFSPLKKMRIFMENMIFIKRLTTTVTKNFSALNTVVIQFVLTF